MVRKHTLKLLKESASQLTVSKTISWVAVLMFMKINQQWTQCVTLKAQISTVDATDCHTGSLCCLLHKTKRKDEHLQAAFLAPSSTKLPTHLLLSFSGPSTSNVKREENNETLQALSYCLQKEHLWIALHIEIYFFFLKKKKRLHRFPFLLHQFKFQVWNLVIYMKTWLIFVFKKRKAEICPNWSSAFFSLHILYLTFIC